MQNQICFLLSYVKYGDNDAFLHCFSQEEGFQSFFAKGIYSAKNKKKPYLLPLNLLNISLVKKGINKGIPLVSKLELAGDFHDFHEVKTNSILFFGAEFLHQILREEGANQSTFSAIHHFRHELIKSNYNAHLILLFQFLKICGIAPHSNQKDYLNPESGIFEGVVSHPIFTAEISSLWQFFLERKNTGITLNREQRNELVESLMLYYQIHITGFQTPKSLLILRQIFE